MARRIVAPAAGAPKPVKREKLFWGDIYTGTPGALIAARVIEAHQVPPAGKRLTFFNGEQVVRRRFRDGEPYVRVSYKNKTTLSVVVAADRNERERREEERQRAHKSQEAIDQIAFDSEPENLRQAAVMALRVLQNVISSHLPRAGSEGRQTQFNCRFVDDEARKVLASLATIDDWLDEVEICRISASARRLEVARSDPGFQAFLRSQCLKG